MIDFNNSQKLNVSDFETLTENELLSSEFLLGIYDISEEYERERIKAILTIRATKLGCESVFKSVIKSLDEANKKLNNNKFYQNYTELNFICKQLRCDGWEVNASGIRCLADSRLVSSTPFVPVALLKNMDDNSERVKLSYLSIRNKNQNQEIICSRSVLASSSAIVKLADNGLHIDSNNARSVIKYLADILSLNRELPCVDTVSSLGWSNKGFVPYSNSVEFDATGEFGSLYNAISTQGDFTEWTQKISQLRNNTALRLCMAASFASVLIERLNVLPFVFHLWGGTGTGKTVTLMVAASIWGNPSQGKLVRSMNMTLNSMLSTAACLKNIPFFGDELQTVRQNTGNYDRLIMQTTEGIDRGRMRGDELQPLKSWHCAFIFSGEEPCTKTNSGGGAKNRVIEIETTQPLIEPGQGNETVNFVTEHYGHAGKAFVEHVAAKDDLKSEYSEIFKMVQANSRSTEKQISSMSLMLLADKLACECIFKDEQSLNVEECCSFLSSSEDVSISERAYRFIVDYISINRNRFLGFDINKETFGEVWGRYIANSKIVDFSKSKLEECLSENGYSFDAVKRKWKEKGYLRPNSQGKCSNYSTVNGIKSHYVKILLPSEADGLSLDDAPENYNEVLF